MSKRKTTEEFIKEAKAIYGDKYDYSKVVYKNSKTKVVVICPIHGEFQIRPGDHLHGHGCPRCGVEIRSNKAKYSLEEFIKKAKQVHGDKYDYSKVEYKNSQTKIAIICPIHGEFRQIPASHLSGKGCRRCYNEDQKIGQEEFVKKARLIHGDKYDYSKATYKDNITPVVINCPMHGEFKQTPLDHVNHKKGCKKCADDAKRNTVENFIARAKIIHGDKYDYSKVVYKNNYTKVKLKCKKCGHEFPVSPGNHILGHGCPYCTRSRGEEIIETYLKEHNVNFIPQKTFDGCEYKRKLKFDFYLPTENICIEYNGAQHYQTIEHWHLDEEALKINQLRDNIKVQFCANQGIELIVIPYTQHKDIEKILDGVCRRGYRQS